MSTVKNPFDKIKPAGKRYVGKDESAASCLVDADVPEPDQKVKTWREEKTPGVRSMHPAYREHPNAKVPEQNLLGFGKVFKGEAVRAKDVLDVSTTPMQELIVQKAEEAVYKSTKTEKLGQRYVPGELKLPDRTLGPDFRFGIKTIVADAAKSTVFPPPGDAEEEKKEEIYQQSHHSFAPGKQRRDKVDWSLTGVDPSSYKFGRPQVSTERNVVGKLLNPQIDENPSARALTGTVIVNKVTDDFRAFESYDLGKTRGLTLLDKSKHPETYGKPAQRSSAGDWGVADCFRGDFTREEQAPDRDLGKATHHGWRNAGMAPPERRFGLPSVRVDVAPRVQSVASTIDFGNGPKSSELLFPSPYADHGVEEVDFVSARPPGQVRALFEKIGYRMSDAEFKALYERASLHGSITPVGSVCLAEFRQVLNEVLDGRDAGEEPTWFTQAVDGQ